MMRPNIAVYAAVLASLALASHSPAAGDAPDVIYSPAIRPWGLNLTYIDRSVKPGDDFYAYANGGWLKTAEIPADRGAAGAGLEVTLQNDARLKAIVADLHGRADLTEENRKLRDLYDA